jgi:Trk-type K+ transport system membrane component
MIMEYVICWLATFGFSFTFALTHGPLGLFKAIREKAKSHFGEKHWVTIGVGCPVCASFWIAIPFTIASDNGGILMWASALGFTCAVTSVSPD